MSEQVTYTGTLIPTMMTQTEYLEDKDIKGDLYDCMEELDMDLVVLDGMVWEVQKDTDTHEENSFFQLHKTDSDDILFAASYYNGGASLQEVIEEAYSEMKDNLWGV